MDAKTGKIAWVREVGQGSIVPVAREKLDQSAPQRGHQEFHQWQNLASPSPVTDGRMVVVHFGNGELAAYDFDGRRLWRRNLQKDYGEYSVWWGHANSPVLYENLVISVCMQDSLQRPRGPAPAASYVVAHDKQTGRGAMADSADDRGHRRELRFVHHARLPPHRRRDRIGGHGRPDVGRLRPGRADTACGTCRDWSAAGPSPDRWSPTG